ncbi:Uncharacterised protein [Mycobacteroides abscessus subsp. abscessus]|nr:Uncharacterised protein [Mycobacteroides abscessus subsp. abscessus]
MFLSKKRVYTIKEFLAPQSKENSCAHPKLTYGLFGINITPQSLATSGYNDPLFFVIGLGLVCAAVTIGEYMLRANGMDVIADGISDTIKVLFPLSFYTWLVVMLIVTF